MRYALSLNPTGAPSPRASLDQKYVGHRLPETLHGMSVEGQTPGHTHAVGSGAPSLHVFLRREQVRAGRTRSYRCKRCPIQLVPLLRLPFCPI